MSSEHAAWFDRFTAPDGLVGELWSKGAGQWCWRHWAPCPRLGYNGLGCSAELMTIFVAEMAPRRPAGAKAMNQALQAAGTICCTLGDERMYDLWSHWAPATVEEKPIQGYHAKAPLRITPIRRSSVSAAGSTAAR